MYVDSMMLYFSSVYPSATQVLPLYLCKRYATEPVYPSKAVTSRHGHVNALYMKQ